MQTFQRRQRSDYQHQLPSHQAKSRRRRFPALFVLIHISVTKMILTSKSSYYCWIHRYNFNLIFSHLTKEHLPLVAKYACGSCRETFEQLSDHKAHESKHSKEKLPYTCDICCTEFVRARDYNK